MTCCCVLYCKSCRKKKVPGISFHEFPNDLELRDKWLKLISRRDFVPNDKSCSSVVCSLHFKDEDFVPNIKVRRLKSDVSPSIFPGYPSYKVPIPKQKRRILMRTAVQPPKRRKMKLERESGLNSLFKINETFSTPLTTSSPNVDIKPSQSDLRSAQSSGMGITHVDTSCQTQVSFEWFNEVSKEKKASRLKIWKLNKKMQEMQFELDEYRNNLKFLIQ